MNERGRITRWRPRAVVIGVLLLASGLVLATPNTGRAQTGEFSSLADEMQRHLDRPVPLGQILDGRLALHQPDASDEYVAAYLRQADAAAVLDERLESTVGSANYGGVRLDLEIPSIEISVTKSAPLSLDEDLRGALPAVSVRRVDYSMQSLKDAHERVTGHLATLRTRGVDIREIWEDVVSNRVVIGVVEADRAEVSQALADLLGSDMQRVRVEEAPKIVLVPTTCHNRFNCPLGVTVTGTTLPTNSLETVKLRGGVDLRAEGFRCSSGFSARRTSDNAVMMMTAGHCFGLNASVSHNTFRVGVVTSRSWSSTATKDGEAIHLRPVDTYSWERNNWVYTDTSGFTSGNKQHGITAVFNRSGGSQVHGAPISKSGTTTNTTSGQIAAGGVTVPCPAYTCNPDGFDITFTNMTRAVLCSRGGDSGGAVHWSAVAHGIVSLSNENEGACRSSGDLTWFNLASDLETALGVRIYES